MGITHCTKKTAAQARNEGATQIVALNAEKDDFGVYSTSIWLANSFNTPLLFRGTLDECIEWRKA